MTLEAYVHALDAATAVFIITGEWLWLGSEVPVPGSYTHLNILHACADACMR